MSSRAANTTAFAKTTRPEIGNVIAREALFQRLDATPARTVAWISGPAGAGKSTLAASYVDARNYDCTWYQVDPDDEDLQTFFHYLAHAARRWGAAAQALPRLGSESAEGDIPAFARRFFRALFAAAPAPSVLVLDNLHDLPAESALQVALAAALSQVPRHHCIIVTSRSAPGAAHSRLRAAGTLVCLGGDELALSVDELAEVARLRGKPLSGELVARLHARTGGWAAGLVLLLEHLKFTGQAAELPDDATPEVVFDYLAGEIFERFDPATRSLLLRVACLPRMTPEVARVVGACDDAGQRLLNLAHNGYFVREMVGPEGRLFQLHPLLRDFLKRRAATGQAPGERDARWRLAAAQLLAAGQLEDAVTLFGEAQAWPEIAAIVATHAPVLVEQGRQTLLSAWLEWLPIDLIDSEPRLLWAMGAGRLRASPRVARQCFERAHAAYSALADALGARRCCEGAIAASVSEFDDLAAIDRWAAEPSLLEPDTAAAAGSVSVGLAWLLHDPAHPALAKWLQEPRGGAVVLGLNPSVAAAEALREALRAVASALGGDPASAAATLESAAPRVTEPGARATRHLCAGLCRLLEGNAAGAADEARHGLALCAADGLAGAQVWLHLLRAGAALALEDWQTTDDALHCAHAKRRGERALAQLLQAELLEGQGDATAAAREARGAAALAAEAGVPWFEVLARLVQARCLACTSDARGAAAQWRAAKALAQHLASPCLDVLLNLTQAALAFDATDTAGGEAALRAGLAAARELGLLRIAGLRRATQAQLCAHAIALDVEVEYARGVVRRCNLAPPEWPWPFRVETLGAFRLQRGDRGLEFSAKGPGRPVELLKVLIAQGGAQVRADQLADALWPHVDADYAHKSFTATLHRLRRIFDDDDAITLREGRLSLNTSRLWVDTWAFEQVAQDLDTCLRAAAPAAASADALAAQMLALYAGPFLADDADQPAYLMRREQIRARLLRCLTGLTRRWQAQGRADRAVDAYLQCIEADDACEALYQHLMQLHQHLGELGEALGVYERLRVVLAARLHCEPSPQSQALVASLRAK
jgi:LuxR family transcriptional regulator, maltose regulon positive regulatory protein